MPTLPIPILPILSLLLLSLLPPTHSTNLIIVGAGTAGCPLASLLCRTHPDLHVTLLERGNAPPSTTPSHLNIRSPRFAYRAWFDPLITSSFPSVSSVDILAGDTPGGTSAINGLQWSLPINGTTENWGLGISDEEVRGIYGEAFSRVRPREVLAMHGLEKQYFEAARKAGFGNGAFDGADRDSLWRNVVAVGKRGRRRDSCRVYLRNVRRKGACRNLRIVHGARVGKVVMRKRGGVMKATGVVYEKNGERFVQRGRVILSAGAYESPKLLQLSGIGPREVLDRAGIRVKRVLPVGERTVARPAGLVISLYLGAPLDPANNGTVVNSTMALEDWENGRGVLTIPPYAFNGRVKNVGYFGAGSVFGPNIGLDSTQFWSICLLNGVSEGFLRARSGDPDEPPMVDLALLKRRKDLRRMTKCMKRLKDIHAAFPEDFGVVDVSPVDLKEESVRQSTMFAMHFVGGCRMGEVVDRGFRVKGVKDLWVVDSSVLNSLPVSAGPMAAVYMLAHLAAERIALKEQSLGFMW